MGQCPKKYTYVYNTCLEPLRSAVCDADGECQMCLHFLIPTHFTPFVLFGLPLTPPVLSPPNLSFLKYNVLVTKIQFHLVYKLFFIAFPHPVF